MIDNMKKAIIAGFVLVIAGCNTVSPETKAASEKPLICDGKEQCDLYWERAQFYVGNTSKYKIQLANDTVIQTYSPTNADPIPGYQISKEPLGSGKYRIWVGVFCANMFGCIPKVDEEISNVKRYIENGRQ